MVRQNPDPYLVLGVSPTATQADVTHAYRSRLRTHHPDTRHTPSPPAADDNLRQVLAAYALLRDPARRADYDRRAAASAVTASRIRVVPESAERPDDGPTQIPVSHRRTNHHTVDIVSPPLRAGPTRRHH
jgi:curved DNA-binding protein CbpA